MHSPGVCGAILATGGRVEATGPPAGRAQRLGDLIVALNAGTDMVLVAVAADAESLAPAVWARAGYMVELAPGTSDADALRALLRETLNHGRDAALVVSLHGPALSAETVQRMVEGYRDAGDEIWAVVPEADQGHGNPMLLGRRMIELFLRGQKWSAAEEILTANREHVRSVKSGGPIAASRPPGATWKAPWE